MRRLALSVPQPPQQMYIARAKKWVSRALRPRMATNTTMFRMTYFNRGAPCGYGREPVSFATSVAPRTCPAREEPLTAVVTSVGIDTDERREILDDASPVGAMSVIAQAVRTTFGFRARLDLRRRLNALPNVPLGRP